MCVRIRPVTIGGSGGIVALDKPQHMQGRRQLEIVTIWRSEQGSIVQNRPVTIWRCEQGCGPGQTPTRAWTKTAGDEDNGRTTSTIQQCQQ